MRFAKSVAIRGQLREAALEVEQLHFGVSYAAATSSAAVTKPAAWCKN
jgi:hypothetical protein